MRCKLALRCEFSFHDRLNLFPSNSFSFLSFFLLLFFFFLRLRDDEKRRPVVGRWTVKEYRVRGSGRDNGWKQPLLCRWSWEGKKRKCFYFRRVRGNRDFFFFETRRLFEYFRKLVYFKRTTMRLEFLSNLKKFEILLWFDISSNFSIVSHAIEKVGSRKFQSEVRQSGFEIPGGRPKTGWNRVGAGSSVTFG